MGELTFYWHCRAISEDGKITYPNHKDDWRCYCDGETSQGYRMLPSVLIPKSEEVIIGDTMDCDWCKRIYTIIDREIECKGTYLMHGCGKMIPYRLIKSDFYENDIRSYCPYCNVMINWE